MTKYGEQFKLLVVGAYETEGKGFGALAQQYGVSRTLIQCWVDRYRQHGIEGLRAKFSHYSAEFKLSVLQRMQRDELSATQAIGLFDIRGGAGVVLAWERLYYEGGLLALKPKPRGRPKMVPDNVSSPSAATSADSHSLEELRKENEYLRAQVAYLKKLRALLQAKERAAPKKRK